jgi:hypothetical protein
MTQYEIWVFRSPFTIINTTSGLWSVVKCSLSLCLNLLREVSSYFPTSERHICSCVPWHVVLINWKQATSYIKLVSATINSGKMHCIKKSVGQDEKFIVLLGIKRHSIAACCLFFCAYSFAKFPSQLNRTRDYSLNLSSHLWSAQFNAERSSMQHPAVRYVVRVLSDY